ncbi:MAG: response regulator [Anaerolineae bacterium]|nr:response regulator [Anaerolineae bacterium]
MRTILVVDDEMSFLEILQVILERAGYRTIVAANGRDGLNLIYQEHPDLVVLDDMLPGLSGSDICMTVKQDPAVKHIPVILYSAGPRVRDRDFIAQIRADAALYKPFKPSDALKLIQSCLNGTGV